MKFVQGCHSSSQRGGAKSSGDPSETNFKTNDPKPQQRRNSGGGVCLGCRFFGRDFLSGKEITSEFIERELYGIRICQHKTILGPDLLSLAKKMQANLTTVDVCVLQQSVLFDHVFF